MSTQLKINLQKDLTLDNGVTITVSVKGIDNTPENIARVEKAMQTQLDARAQEYLVATDSKTKTELKSYINKIKNGFPSANKAFMLPFNFRLGYSLNQNNNNSTFIIFGVGVNIAHSKEKNPFKFGYRSWKNILVVSTNPIGIMLKKK